MELPDRGPRKSRREFMGGVMIGSFAMAISAREGAAQSSATNRVSTLDLGAKPAGSVSGGILLTTGSQTFLAFKAVRFDEQGSYTDAGTAVVELKQCSATRFRYPDGEPDSEDSFLTDQLAMGEIYEVANSSWIRSVQGTTTRTRRGKRQRPSTRHFVFTFFPTTFECLAADLKVEMWSEPFSSILAYHGFL